MSKQYYKVVRLLENGDLVSALVSDRNFKVKYEVGKWAYPGVLGTKLFVFDDLFEARSFGYVSSKMVYIVEVKNPTSASKYNLFYWRSWFSWSTIRKMLSLKKRKKKFTHLKRNNPLKHSVVVDAVKLISKM